MIELNNIVNSLLGVSTYYLSSTCLIDTISWWTYKNDSFIYTTNESVIIQSMGTILTRSALGADDGPRKGWLGFTNCTVARSLMMFCCELCSDRSKPNMALSEYVSKPTWKWNHLNIPLIILWLL